MRNPRRPVGGEGFGCVELGGLEPDHLTETPPLTQVRTAAIARNFGLSLPHAALVVELMRGSSYGRATR